MKRFLKLLWYDIVGYLKVRAIVKNQKKTVDFNKHGLRTDWVCRVYTVINPSEADKGDTPDVLLIKAQDKMLPIHKYVEKIGLGDYVAVSAEKIPDTNSYLLVYYPIFNVITTFKVVMFFFTIIVGILSYKIFF